jgi:GNAT superfamily N-acetyltransferase
MQVRAIDPNNDDELGSWWAAQHASRSADWPDDEPLTVVEARAIANGGFGGKRFVLAVAGDDFGRTLGCSMLGLPTRETKWVVEADIQVDPAHRRAGVGRELVLHAERLAVDEGRTTVMGGFEEPLEAGAPGRSFAKALGYEIALPEIRRDLGLPIELAQLDALEAACQPFSHGYRIITWMGRTPDELVEGMVELDRSMSRDSPHGDLDHEEGDFDEARLRAAEATMTEMGQIVYNAGAVSEATGKLVAATTIGVSPESPKLARQFGTVVLDADRGHRLGMLVKIANLRALMDLSPRTLRVTTWNGEVNTHMSGVNDELGFVVTARSFVVQKHLNSATSHGQL